MHLALNETGEYMVSRFFTCCKIPAVLIVCMTLLLGGCAGKGTVTAEDTKIVMGTLARITVRADEIAANYQDRKSVV